MIKTVLLVFLSESLAAAGQIAFKKSANLLKREHKFHSIGAHAEFMKDVLARPGIWMGFIALGLSLAVWLIALAGAELSLVFSLGSLQYIIILIGARIFLGEKIDLMKLVGTLTIVAGIVCIALS